MAFCYYQLGNYKDAKIFFNHVLKLDTINASAINYLGLISEKEYDFSKAQNYYEQLIQIDSTNSYYFKQNAFMAVRTGRPLWAVYYFEKARKINRFDIVTLFELSKLYLQLKDLAQAEEILNWALQVDSTNIKILQSTAQLKYDLKNFEATSQFVQRMMEYGDSTVYFLKLLGYSLVNLDKYEAAVEVLIPALSKVKDKEIVHYYLAAAYNGLEDFLRAEEHYHLAIKAGISINIPVYYSNLASLFEDKKQYKKAIESYKKAYDFNPKPENLFHIAKNSDNYYRDKKICMRWYQKYLDTKDKKFRQYSLDRIAQLKEIIHFQIGG
jgi:tetratricopeptide (TPR) repeat protein